MLVCEQPKMDERKGDVKRLRRHHKWRGADQSSSDADQTAADADQTASDTDQSTSDRDQAQADADQRASDRDQAASNHELGANPLVDALGQQAYEMSRSERVEGTLERGATRAVRGQIASERDEGAKGRDETARARDRTADERDRAADDRDREVEQLARELGSNANPRAAAALEFAAAARAQAAATRTQAAVDRERAARDREAAASDRAGLQRELDRAHLDGLTGAFRRGMGETVVRHEIERARRSKGDLALAFMDVDGLKQINDRLGHGAGDALLRDLVKALRSRLRPYDPVVRWGGDEFVCAVSGTALEVAGGRLDEALEVLAESQPGAAISVGLATLIDGDTLETLVDRADQALLQDRRKR
jgi:diguanylate cyclase (GGDEF)-like protein